MKPVRSAGFTLLEILLVLVVMGLIATSVAPRLSIGSSGRDLQLSTDRLVTLSKAAHQSALVEGRSLGLRLLQDDKSQRLSYQFMTLNKGKWQALKKHSMLREVVLPADLSMTIKDGASFWREAIEYETTSNDFLIDIAEKAIAKPDIYFWSSGEISPVQAMLCINSGKLCREVVFEETGEVYDREPMEG